jgi:hypothetical protein
LPGIGCGIEGGESMMCGRGFPGDGRWRIGVLSCYFSDVWCIHEEVVNKGKIMAGENAGQHR